MASNDKKMGWNCNSDKRTYSYYKYQQGHGFLLNLWNYGFDTQTSDIRSPTPPPKGAFFAVYSTPVGIPREVDYRSRTWRFINKVQLAFSAGVRLVSIGENQSD